jgi:hypothetical protein
VTQTKWPPRFSGRFKLSDLYVRGFNINDFHNQIDPGNPEEVDEAVDTIRLHHPGQVVWVEYSHAA